MRTLAPAGASTRSGGGRRELNTIVRISFSLEGEVHVSRESTMAAHSGGHRRAAPQRVRSDEHRHGVADAWHERKREREPGVEGAEDGPERGAI